jgi:hypothetical protein
MHHAPSPPLPQSCLFRFNTRFGFFLGGYLCRHPHRCKAFCKVHVTMQRNEHQSRPLSRGTTPSSSSSTTAWPLRAVQRLADRGDNGSSRAPPSSVEGVVIGRMVVSRRQVMAAAVGAAAVIWFYDFILENRTRQKRLAEGLRDRVGGGGGGTSKGTLHGGSSEH